MAKSKRNKTPGRVAILLGTSIATLTFLVTVMKGPQPGAINIPSTMALNSAPVQSQSSTRSSAVTSTSPSLSQQSTTRAPAAAAAPRLRTRGS
ncbi:MAG: hypothetical protein Q7O66_03715 [Dehalococcoidia bacterium]|nr:hypothetical protein [Dehalococcoidia bacterium]